MAKWNWQWQLSRSEHWSNVANVRFLPKIGFLLGTLVTKKSLKCVLKFDSYEILNAKRKNRCKKSGIKFKSRNEIRGKAITKQMRVVNDPKKRCPTVMSWHLPASAVNKAKMSKYLPYYFSQKLIRQSCLFRSRHLDAQWLTNLHINLLPKMNEYLTHYLILKILLSQSLVFRFGICRPMFKRLAQ